VSIRPEPCGSCELTKCNACPHFAAFSCDLCRRESCEDCSVFRYALWTLAGLLESPHLEKVIWP